MLSTLSPVDQGYRRASCDTSLLVSGGVDCGRRRWNVNDKKPQHYAKDNRTLHLTARSDKSVAYITNNKRLYLTFCTVEANYWQTWSIAWPLCDSRATCDNWLDYYYWNAVSRQIWRGCHTSVNSGDLNQVPPKQSAVCSTCIIPAPPVNCQFIWMASAFGMSATQPISGWL